MRLALLALLPSLALANGNPIARGLAKNRLGSGKAYTFKFLDDVDGFGSYVCTGDSPTGDQGEAVTFARASSAYCTNASGTLVLLSSNQPVIQSQGLSIKPAYSQLIYDTQDLTSANWSTSNATVGTADQHVAPDGTTTAEEATSTSAGGYVYQPARVTRTSTDVEAAVYVKTSSGTQSVAIRIRDTTNNANRCTGTATATTTWQRLSCACAGCQVTGDGMEIRLFPGGVSGTGTAVFWQVDLFNGWGTGIPPSVKAEGTPATSAAETLLLSPAGSDWPYEVGCARLTYTPIKSSPGSLILLQAYRNTPTVDYFQVRFGAAGTTLQWEVANNGTARTGTSTPTFTLPTAGTSYPARVTWTGSGRYSSFFWNGTGYGSAIDNTGTMGDYRTNGKLYVGSSSGGTLQASGYISNVLFDASSASCD